MDKYVIALDSGTTSCRAIIYDGERREVSRAQQEIRQFYPHHGWVEHDPMEIYAASMGVMNEAAARAGIEPGKIAAIGITNQRETTIVWDRKTGEPVYNAIVWQCRRTAQYCERLKEEGMEEYVFKSTGLVLDAYFSATKIKWILDNVDGARERAERGELLFGTVDSWLVYKLCGVHVTDYTNAARTMAFNIRTLQWDGEILHALGLPASMFPRPVFSDEIYGYTHIAGSSVPVAGMAGDQQAALFGQRCFEPASVKNTYGTGCFLLCNTGEKPVMSKNRLLTTIGTAAGGKIQYALEGSVFIAGALIQWLRDELRIISTAAESEKLALECADSGGVYVVPAFTGLGAPYWDMYARGAILGLTRGSGRPQIARAALEGIAYQTADVIEAVRSDTGLKIDELKVDGGASANGLLMQIQADTAGVTVLRPDDVETTARGAAYLAGLAAGLWDMDVLRWEPARQTRFEPSISAQKRKELADGWKKAVSRVR